MEDKFSPDLIYTKVDEAPELASASLLPIITRFVKPAGLTVGRRDISLAGRVISAFPDYLRDTQRQTDDLSELAKWVKSPKANVIKLPNISASIPQLVACIKELQEQSELIMEQLLQLSRTRTRSGTETLEQRTEKE